MTATSWDHNMCRACWYERNPRRVPRVFTEAEEDICCYCGRKNHSGIVVREDPMEVHKAEIFTVPVVQAGR